jgi:UDP-glucose:(heptosyl)LPS alpha-1,3-glucosyltransferase
LKVALVILHADPARGGAERYTFDLAQALAARGVEVALVASTFGPRPARVECVELGRRGVTRLGQYRAFLDALDAHLDASAYDVVHAMLPVRRCDAYHPHAGVAAEAIVSGHTRHAALLRRWLAAGGNRVNVKRNAFARVERALLERDRPPVVLCLSDYVKETVRRHYPQLAQDRLATLFNAVDLARFDPAARPDQGAAVRARYLPAAGAVMALMIAQDFARKGLAEAIRALAQLGDQRVRLVVVGKQAPNEYRALARRLGVEGRVAFAGPTADPYPFYSAADFFVLPTRHDPCSLVVLEALAMGVPVISTRQNGACEVMADGVHGAVLASADDSEALERAMRDLSDPATRAPMRDACLALRPRLAYQRHLDDLMRIYQRIVDNRRGPL